MPINPPFHDDEIFSIDRCIELTCINSISHLDIYQGLIAEAIGDYFAQTDCGNPHNDLDGLQQRLIDVKTIHKTKPNQYSAAKETLNLVDGSYITDYP